MAQFKQWFTQDLTESIVVRHCESVMFTGDDNGAVVGVRLYDDGTPYSSGGTVNGFVKRIDGGVVVINGTLSGNAASIVLPAAALAYAGPIGVQITLTQGGQVTTVLKVIYSVDDTTGTPVDPGSVMPSLPELIAEANAAIAAMEAKGQQVIASIPPDYTELSDLLLDTRKNVMAGAVQPQALEFAIFENNFVNPDDPRFGAGILNSSGEVEPSNSYNTTGFVRINGGYIYYLGGTVNSGRPCARRACTYDKDFNIVRYLEYPQSITAQSNEKYLRISGTKTMIQVVSLDSMLPQEFTAKIPAEYLDIPEASHIDDKIQVPMPEEFDWPNCPIKNLVYQNYQGGVYVGLDVSAYKNTESTACYISPDGDDNNDGSEYSPLASLSAAIARNVDTIYVKGGFYDREHTISTINHSVNIIAYKNQVPLLTSHAGADFVLYDNVSTYYYTRSNFCGIYDLRYKDKYGYPLRYEKKSTIEDVQANPGSFAHINGIIYVRCIGGSDPNQLQQQLRLIVQSDYTPITIDSNSNVYLEGLNMFGGGRSLYAVKPSAQGEMNIFAKNCKFYGSSSTNRDAVQIIGASFVYFQNCEALHSLKDGFNYHVGNGVIPKAIEVFCKGRFNGTDVNAANQGSTMHDGGKIIRVGGIYTNNHGSNVADEGGSQAWMIGCTAIESKAVYNDQNMGFYSYENCDMWLDTCAMIANKYCVGGGGNKYVRNPRFNGTVCPEGVAYIEY